MGDPTPSEAPLTAGGRSRRNWLGWALAAFIMAGLAVVLDLGEVAAVLGRVRPLEIAGILVVFTLDRLLMAWKWSILLQAVGVRLPLGTITRFYYQGTLSGTFMPSHVGGDLLRAHWVAQASGVRAPVFASVVMEKLIGLLSAANWAVVGLVVFAVVMHGELWWIWVGLGILALVAGNGLFVLSMRPAVHDFVLGRLGRWGGTSRFVSLLHRFYEAYARYGNAPRAVNLNILLTLIAHGTQMVVILLIARSVGIDVGTVAFLAVTAVHTLVYRLPIAPDGWGVGELAAIGLYGQIGVGAEAAFSMMFLAHLLQMAVVLPGLWFLLRGDRRPSPARTR